MKVQKDYFVGTPISVTDYPKHVQSFIASGFQVSGMSPESKSAVEHYSPTNLASSTTLIGVPPGLMSGSVKKTTKQTKNTSLISKMNTFCVTRGNIKAILLKPFIHTVDTELKSSDGTG